MSKLPIAADAANEFGEAERRLRERAETRVGIQASRRPGAYRAPISAASIERVLSVGVQAASVALVVLSVVGTFYGAQGRDAPIGAPWRIFGEMAAAPNAALLALVAQGALTVVQWGGRRMARRDPRWWLAYLGSLALSIWWNWSAYGDPLVALNVPWLVALGLVAAGDVLPEMALVREE